MATPAASKTRTDDVYEWLRADILGGVLTPGERLKFRPLCSRYNASVSLVREVLSRLAEQAWCVRARRSGSR